ncbi:MAG TPA: aliphatic sulfonate ABC transporter substrate-binding protein [bacterium]|jgi:sulfonate transport system substrate-binding protein|nr:aliphatic sulfonate ABC transporter substrate-binding protein [bacterium]
MKKIILASLLIVGFAVPAMSQEIVRIGYQPISSAIVLGKAKGFYDQAFAKLGAKAEFDLFLSGPLAVEAAAGDHVDLFNVGNMPPVIARANGIDVKIIAKSAFNPATNAVLVGADSSAHSIEELKGKKVAVQVGSSVHYFLSQILAEKGMTLQDVQLVNLPGPDQGPALESGAVDAIVLWMPYRTQLEMAGKARVLADSAHVSGGIGVYMVRNEFGKKRPLLVTAFLKATKQANDYLKKHPKEALALLAKGSQFPPAVLKKSLEGFDWSMGITSKDITGMNDIKTFLKETKVIRKDFAIQDLFDDSYFQQAGIR